jgi:hypothetical protein
VLLTPGGCQSNLRLFTRGSVIGGESISLGASAVINQTADFLIFPPSGGAEWDFLGSEGKSIA